MTYGIYTKDLTGCSLHEMYNLEDDRRYLIPGHVICSEKKVRTGFVIKVEFSKFWDFRLRPKWGYLRMGYMEISWRSKTILWADKVVETAKEDSAKGSDGDDA